MAMTIAILIYIVLLFIFLIVSSLIFRHAVKFGYLAPSFKILVVIFGIIALAVIVFSVFLLFQIGSPNEVPYMDSYNNSPGGLNF